MKPAITQKHSFGCGAACVAFVSGVSYGAAVRRLGATKAATMGFYCRDLVTGLAELGCFYEYKYLKSSLRRRIYKEGTIVFIARSKRYPAGHYLARADGGWMDPWLNFSCDHDITNAQSGYRRRLPGRPVYVLFRL